MTSVPVEKLTVVCAWCGVLMFQGDANRPVSHGMCARCVGTAEGLSVEDIGTITTADLDCLPIGIVRISPTGEILAFNQTESGRFGYQAADVLGKNFFKDVAPCTSVKEFRGRFDALVQKNQPGRETLDFVFCTENWSKLVQVVLLWEPEQERGTLMISTPG